MEPNAASGSERSKYPPYLMSKNPKGHLSRTRISMTLTRVSLCTMIAITWLGVQAQAQPPCPEVVRLRNAATEAWKEVMRAPRPERCGTLNHSSRATEATLNYANSNRESCNISVRLLSDVEGYHREPVQARDNVCAGRPMRPGPAEIIRH